MEKNLTPLQQKLVDDLIKEFTKINPKPTNGTKRFGFDTINECNQAEERFYDTIRKHNTTMMKVFTTQFSNEIRAFKKEFGKVLDVQIGHHKYDTPCGTYESWFEKRKKGILDCMKGEEMLLFIVSKNKPYNIHADSRYNYCNGRAYCELYATFKVEKVETILESGKKIYAYKIVGMQYSRHNWLNNDKVGNATFQTLDELIQTEKSVQEKIVSLAS